MEDIVMNGEQPQENQEVKQPVDIPEGSSLGKFKSEQSLLEAYNNLQAEFTRKCQKLSELEKHSLDNVSNVVHDNGLEQTKESEVSTENVKTPRYMSATWADEVTAFVENNKYASSIVNEVVEMLMNDDELSSQPKCLELAYNTILAKKFKDNSEIISDEDFLQKYILSNEKIRTQVIQDYLYSLNKNNVPTVISKSKGSHLNMSSNRSPKTLREASEWAELLFKN